MSPVHTSRRMTWFPANFHKAAGMDSSKRKSLVLVCVLLLCELSCGAQVVSECCRTPARSCRLYALLCRPGNKVLAGDASMGILTLGKRAEDELRFQSRLNQLLHGSRNQAAGILTMGRREEERQRYSDWMEPPGRDAMTPSPV